MSQKRVPWFLGLATITALTLSRGSAGPSATPPPPGGPEAGALRFSEAGPRPQNVYVRVYDEFFGAASQTGQPTPQLRGTWAENRVDLQVSTANLDEDAKQSDLDRIAKAAQNDYDLEFLVALVPDPIDSRLASVFDFTLAGLQTGLNRANYLFDRGWHPWTTSAAVAADPDERPAHKTAGIMLFRKPDVAKTRLLAVFLVGETPKGGIHRRAFHQAVDFITRLQNALTSHAASPIRILGPSFSGSAESLRDEMRSLPAPTGFTVVSGSATAPLLKEFFESKEAGRVCFSRTVVPDDQLTEKALGFLKEKLGWDLSHAALLIEGDTAYGGYFSNPSSGSLPTPMMDSLTKLLFPSGLSTIRNAWEENGSGRGSEGAGREPAGMPRTALQISLADRGTPADSILELSPLTSRIEEMAMASLLRTIVRQDIRYVGIVATDVKDEVFLAEQVRRWAPDVTLFLFESNLIYVHPHFHPALFGTLVITSFPMLTNEVDQLPEPPPGQGPIVQQFGSETQKGIFLATQRLLNPLCLPNEKCALNPQCLLNKEIEAPAVWIAANGNDTMSPVARVDLTADPASVSKVIFFPEGNDLQLFFALISLCVLAYWLGERVYLQRDVVNLSATSRKSPVATRLLLLLGDAVLCILGSGIIVLALWPICAHNFFIAEAEPLRGGLHGFVLATTVLAYLYLLLYLARHLVQTARGFLGRRTPRLRRLFVAAIGVAVLLSGILLCWSLEYLILHYGSQPGFLYLRVRRFANGLSPFVSLAWLGGALFVWISAELRRRQLKERYRLDWPIPDDGAEPALSGYGAELKSLTRLLDSTLPRSLRFWSVVAVATLPTAALLWKTAQPLADPRWYGRVFVILVLGAFVLSVASFYRFGRTWFMLRRLLGRLEHCRCLPTFKSIAGIVKWKAMSSFVWYTSSFASLAQSVEQLEELEREDHSAVARGALKAAERAVFKAEAEGRFLDEVAAREEVSAIADQIDRHLTDEGLLPEVHKLHAIRVVGWLRHVFIQLRYALMGAMVPALFLIAALSFYTFVPSRFMLLLFWTAVLTASAVSLVIFVQMDRDVVLSEIGDTSPGKVTFDRALLLNIFAYAILPLLALISSQLPQVGQALGHFLDPLTRLLEVG